MLQHLNNGNKRPKQKYDFFFQEMRVQGNSAISNWLYYLLNPLLNDLLYHLLSFDIYLSFNIEDSIKISLTKHTQEKLCCRTMRPHASKILITNETAISFPFSKHGLRYTPTEGAVLQACQTLAGSMTKEVRQIFFENNNTEVSKNERSLNFLSRQEFR